MGESFSKKDDLLAEANSWKPDEDINWSQLATKYGLTTKNRGQTFKEFLAESEVPAAQLSQRPTRAPRREKKKFKGGRTSVPMLPTARSEMEKLKKRIQDGDISVGDAIVPRECTQYKVTDDLKRTTETSTVFARKIPLRDVRERLLKKHESQGLEFRMKISTQNLVLKMFNIDLLYLVRNASLVTAKKFYKRNSNRLVANDTSKCGMIIHLFLVVVIF